ncbi:BZ3500_MvSof-1268-A1-R1_Chr1-2g01353 [Microbotryum saponariae]|uniref:Protein transport protein SEC31 n=1 Tax=Microbotryum saponariae TaxID=289078 RepID=A0A2X0LLU4_9BASI|nr:BZ3500_MvSof-1268-A1-R1_Chr1-2g01353 [Microbotryum saponariae]SCZ97183.1 BZ3501_MvSof-1269-A2-R1_Chr1-2g00952 [Microbotryum saponariae]
MVTSIARTAVPIWSPQQLRRATPLLATGTVSGALDASFSSDSLLELWDPFAATGSSSLPPVEGLDLGNPNQNRAQALLDQTEQTELSTPLASLAVGSRFNRLAWGHIKQPDKALGVIAAGLENGEIGLWDPSRLIDKTRGDASLARYDLHKGPVRGLDFNQHQTNLLASGATNGEIFIWDLTTPSKPFSPGARSRSLDDITALAWNSHVVHVLATGSNSGYTVVWDLKSKREVTALSYSGVAPTGVGSGFGQPGWGAPGGSRGVSAVQWHPTNPTKLATATDDDHNPIIMLWDLRNWKEPERILTGHEKGILSLDWCSQDADLLLSSGKDGRTIAWNPSTSEMVAEVTPSSNWSFDTQWCPRNPSIISTASLDGKITLQSIQSTAAPTAAADAAATSMGAGGDGTNMFEAAISANAANYPTKSLAHAPKWLRRPASVAFGFGGKLVSISHTAAPAGAAPGTPATPSVSIRNVVVQPEVVERAVRLDEAQSNGTLAQFCEQRSAEIEQSVDIDPKLKEGEVSSWKLLASLFGAQSKGGLIDLLGFDRSDHKAKVDEAVKALKEKLPASTLAISTLGSNPEGVNGVQETADGAIPLGSELDDSTATSNSLASEVTKQSSETTEPSLFGGADDGASLNAGASQAAADFYSQIGSGRAGLPDHLFSNGNRENFSSAAATAGSTSSVASLNLRATTFKIYRDDESEVDRLITKALVLGDFASAVALALSNDRFADAILFAVRGGDELLATTQSIYFERQQAAGAPYLRVLQSIVGNDLADVVQNAHLAQWKEIFVVLCTYANANEFPSLCEQLGQRLEYQYDTVKDSSPSTAATELRKNAILCYLAAGKLEKVVGIWVQQMEEDEQASRAQNGAHGGAQRYEAHAKALSAFVEKVSVFQQAVDYVDTDLHVQSAEPGRRVYKLAELYERYVEYAELLAAQGLSHIALKYIVQVPHDFQGSTDASGPSLARDRLLRATGNQSAGGVFGSNQRIVAGATPVASTSYGASNNVYGTSNYSNYGQPAYAQQQSSGYAPAQSSYGAPPLQNNAYGTSQRSAYAPAGGSTSSYNNALDDPYGPGGGHPTNAYGAAPPVSQPFNPYGRPQPAAAPMSDPYAPQQGSGFVPPTPALREQSPNYAATAVSSIAPPPRSKPDIGWNDAPQVQRKATPAAATSAAPPPKAAPITSPFPNMSPAQGGAGGPPPPAFGGAAGGGGFAVPPPTPSRGSNRTPAPVPPPPQAGQRFANAPPVPQPSAAPSPYAPPPPQALQPQQQSNPSPSPYAPPPAPQGQRFAPPPPPQGGAGARPTPPAGFPAPPAGYRGPPVNDGDFRPSSAAGRGRPFPPGQGPRGPTPNAPQSFATNGNGPAPPNPYAPPPSGQAPSGPYAPPAGAQNGPPRPGGFPGPPQGYQPQGGPAPPPPSQTPTPAPPPGRPGPPKPKYPPGDTTHIPAESKPIYTCLNAQLTGMRNLPPGPPQQRKMVEDTAKRLSMLFDALNCETLSVATRDRLLEICRAIDAKNKAQALDLHLQMLTSGANDLAAWQAAVKLIISRLP